MQRALETTILQAGSSSDWTDYHLPTAVCDNAHQMMLTLSNISSLSNAGGIGQEQVPHTVEDFLAGESTYAEQPECLSCGRNARGLHYHDVPTPTG